MSTNAVNRYFEGLLVGGLFGIAIGMLTAPKRGSELRKELADNADDFVKYAEEHWGELKGQVSDTVQPLARKGKILKEKVTVAAEQAKDRAMSIKDRVTDQTSELRADLKDRVDNLKDKALDLKEKTVEQIENLQCSNKDVMDNYMGNNSGPMYRPGAQAAEGQSVHTLGDAHSTTKPNLPGAGGG